MEFWEFCKEKERMCKFRHGFDKESPCLDCGIQRLRFEKELRTMEDCNFVCIKFPKEAEQIVEQWAKEHPIVTNGMKFTEIFGETFCSNMLIGSTNEWWHTEYQPPKGEK